MHPSGACPAPPSSRRAGSKTPVRASVPRVASRVVPATPKVPHPAPAPATRLTTLIGRVLGDKYAIRDVLGEGGMGAVYVAEHLTIGGEVAVKVLHPNRAENREAASRLRHEARVAGTIGHPNICTIYDLGKLDDGRPFVVMERLHGETLGQRIRRQGRMPYAELIDIFIQVLSALVAAHERSIIHRDLTPENIFLSHRPGMAPIPKLLDFGVSKAENIEDTCADLTEVGPAAGTPYYMAPEIARGERGIDARVDIWASGVILYEGLSGRRPFEAANYNALLVAILNSVPETLTKVVPGLPVEVARVVERSLAKRREDRFPSAMAMQTALRHARPKGAAPDSVLPAGSEEQEDATTVFWRRDGEVQMDPRRVVEEPLVGEDEMTIVDPPMVFPESGRSGARDSRPTMREAKTPVRFDKRATEKRRKT